MRLISTACILALAAPALAQDAAADWDILRNPDQRLVMAYTVFDNGLGISVRCRRDSYEAVLIGLPAAPENQPSRTVGVSFGDDESHMQRWNVAIDRTVALSELPAPFARKLRLGGRLQLVLPDGAGPGRNLRYALTLPASAATIDETLTACDRPLTDPRDAELEDLPDTGLPGDMVWVRQPRATYPSNRYGSGFALVSCLTSPNGALRDCVVESEHPADGGFGDVTLRAARRSVVGMAGQPGAEIPVRKVQFRTRFYVQGHQPTEETSRQPRSPVRGARGNSD